MKYINIKFLLVGVFYEIYIKFLLVGVFYEIYIKFLSHRNSPKHSKT